MKTKRKVLKLSYVESEYGIKPSDMKIIAKNILAESKRAVAAGEYVTLEEVGRKENDLKQRHSNRIGTTFLVQGSY